MKDEYRNFLLLILFVAGGLAVLSATALWAVNSGLCIGCGEPRPTVECYNRLNVYNETLENGSTVESPRSCYGDAESADVEGLEGSRERPDILMKTTNGLVLNSTGEKVSLAP